MLTTKASVTHSSQTINTADARPSKITDIIASLCILLGGGWRVRKSLAFSRVLTPAGLQAVGAFRRDRYGQRNNVTLENDFDAEGLDGYDMHAIVYVAKLDNRIIATIRGVAGAPLTEAYFGKSIVQAVVGTTDDYVEIGRLAISSDTVGRRYGKGLIIFSIIDLFITHGFRKYIGYFKLKNEKKLKYMKNSNLHRVNYKSDAEDIPYVMFFGNSKTLIGQFISVIGASRRARK